jgi:HlyD family secretion protein
MLDDRTRRSQSERVETALAQLLYASAGIDRARVGLEQTRLELRRTEQLAQQGFVAPTKLDGDRLAVQGAQRGLEAAQAQHHMAEHDVAQARAALAAVQQGAPGSKASTFVLRAPVAGRVLRVLQASEGAVALGTPLIELGDIRRLEIVAELLTTDALQTATGTRVLIERWGGPGALEGRVRRVEPAAFTKVSALGVEEQRVKVLIDMSSPPEQWQSLGDAYRVGVRIVTLAVDQALQVPASAVFPWPAGSAATAAAAATSGPIASASMAVFALRNGRAQQVAVTLGGRNGGTAWVKTGLQRDDVVIIYPPATVQDGSRVRARKV